ncbi:alpha/beta hydrolase [Cohaesibacter haloalkalitolerans]|uniref:alpha/beta hydrolase n=1 Tax=Cohaesibacter haloalkalitolerans TaxID=1162980 RepID=UPI000E646BF1|nr:alpha/beta hydrolase [Cohaesibacter haloalkalitolerans]
MGKITTMIIAGAWFAMTSIAVAAGAETWDKTFPLSDKVVHQKVSYPNRYGIMISADLYIPKDIDKSKKYDGIIIGPPFGGVKEQGPGVYANSLAERGFVAVAFDQSYNGESGGEPRNLFSWDFYSEDYSAGVDFLGSLPYVDRNKIGAIGICGGGSFVLTAAQVDRRIKAVVTSVMYDFNMRNRFNGDQNALNTRLDRLGEQRWKDFEAGVPEHSPQMYPDKPTTTIPEGLDPVRSEFYEYYGMKRGHHPRAAKTFTLTSMVGALKFPLFEYIDQISPRPILFIVGEKAHSRTFGDEAFKRAKDPKELYVVPGARHIDLYDRVDMIPFEKISNFFSQNLK